MILKKISLTMLLIVALLILIALLAFGLLLVFVYDATEWTTGYISILAFLFAAFIFGYSLNFSIDYIKRLWE